ncbi:TPA: flagellar hook capping protein [bacterium]|nr:flagellar hook capping protein [bacterium]
MSSNVPPVGSGVGNLSMHRIGLGREDFLKLLVTQMKNQNPLEPLHHHEFIAQLATFSTLEQVIQLNENFVNFTTLTSKANVLSMLNKEVKVKADTDEIITGKVVEIGFEKEKIMVTISHPGGILNVGLDSLVSVKN